jgi:hypothetical protein
VVIAHHPLHIDVVIKDAYNKWNRKIQLWCVEFWAEYGETVDMYKTTYQVYGTGQPIPDYAIYRGTAPRKNGLVFHLYAHELEYLENYHSK